MVFNIKHLILAVQTWKSLSNFSAKSILSDQSVQSAFFDVANSLCISVNRQVKKSNESFWSLPWNWLAFDSINFCVIYQVFNFILSDLVIVIKIYFYSFWFYRNFLFGPNFFQKISQCFGRTRIRSFSFRLQISLVFITQ